MAYFIDLFSPETYEAFAKSDQSITGFRPRHHKWASQIHPGDRFICYLTRLSRWGGILEAKSECFEDMSPRFYLKDDPFVIRFEVQCVAWLPKEKAIPISEDRIWKNLSFTKDLKKHSLAWTGKVRSSLAKLTDTDGRFLETEILAQLHGGKEYVVDEDAYARMVIHRVRTTGGVVGVTIPGKDEKTKEPTQPEVAEARESIKIQGLLAKIGTEMGFRIWIPAADRAKVAKEMDGKTSSLLDELPLNYDDTTLKTVQQIDVLWLKGRSISRAFEVEHTTSIYSGLLRMADLLALQPNMDIRLHIVAPPSRREKVFQEIQRPVFSLLDRGPLSKACTYISYDSVRELAEQPHLAHLADSVLEEYEEEPE